MNMDGQPAPAPPDYPAVTNLDSVFAEAKTPEEEQGHAPAPAPVVGGLKPGIMTITLHEARSLSFPGEHQNDSRPTGKCRPYAVVDFDKVQILIRSVGGSLENPLWAGSDTPYQFDVSSSAEVTIHIFIRSLNAAPGSGRSQDICLGVVRLNPQFGANTLLQGAASSGCSGVGWVDIHHGTGQLQLGVSYTVNQTSKLEANDFELLKAVGNGTFGHILQVRKKDTNRIYAMKILRKAYLPSGADVATLVEQSVLAQANNPFIVPLKFSFEFPKKLYLVSAFVGGSGLLEHLSKEGRFDVNRCRFYAAELICAFECLHGFDFMYRDLKPENILLDYQGHIAICDFSLCKLGARGEDSVETFGTPEFVAPELLLGHGHGMTADWWTLGVLLYEMLTGLPVFYDEATDEMHRKILSEPLHFTDIIPPTAKSLLSKLLNRDPVERLGVNGAAEIKAHPFFNVIDWGKLMRREYEPVFKPNEASTDTRYCDYGGPSSELSQGSYVDGPVLSQEIQDQFVGFKYNRPGMGLNNADGSSNTLSPLEGPRAL